MLWNGGISFGGVVSFIFADLIIIPIIVIYRKYYGPRMALFLAGTFYLTMVAAGYLIAFGFAPLHLIPTGPQNPAARMTGVASSDGVQVVSKQPSNSNTGLMTCLPTTLRIMTGPTTLLGPPAW